MILSRLIRNKVVVFNSYPCNQYNTFAQEILWSGSILLLASNWQFTITFKQRLECTNFFHPTASPIFFFIFEEYIWLNSSTQLVFKSQRLTSFLVPKSNFNYCYTQIINLSSARNQNKLRFGSKYVKPYVFFLLYSYLCIF